MKKQLSLICIFFILSCLSSCSIFRELKEGLDEAFVLIEDFCYALANDDIESAKGFLHLDSTPSKDNLSTFILNLEQTHQIDFSDGVVFKRRAASRSAYYDSSYDGTVHEVEYKIVIGGVSVDLFFTIVDNNMGYGIYSFGIEK